MLPASLIDAWLLEALIAATAGDRFAARRALQIALAEPLDGLRPFVQHRRASAKLLARHHGSFGASDDLADRALTARRESEEAILSAHELTVLEMLSSIRSFSEIADDLTARRASVGAAPVVAKRPRQRDQEQASDRERATSPRTIIRPTRGCGRPRRRPVAGCHRGRALSAA